VYRYRVHFPTPDDTALEVANAEPAEIEVEEAYEVGSRFEYEGRAWVVTQMPLEQQTLGAYADIMVWPADS
jgi:hypothetical protein